MDAPNICLTKRPVMPWMTPTGARLPGLSPIPNVKWLHQDDAFAEQMAYRDALIKNKRPDVYACLPHAEASARELLAVLTVELPENYTGYTKRASMLTRPDGLSIETDTDTPLLTAGQLVQEDFALLKKSDDAHVLVGGCICFPAHWSLAEKMGRSLGELHAPVPAYDVSLTKRVDRVFDNLRVDTLLERANFLIYTDPDLHQPVPDHIEKTVRTEAPRYVRCERQTLRRLPETGVIVFAVHTSIYPASALPAPAYAALAKLCPELNA